MGHKLDTLYKNILSYCSMEPNRKDEIDIVFADDCSPATIEGRRLVMPTEEHLKGYVPDKQIIFHPLHEHINRGESDVVKKLRYHLNVRINYTILAVASALLELVGSTKHHRNLTPEQRELLLAIDSADANTAAKFNNAVIKPFSASIGQFFSTIYLKKAGTFQGKKHARVGVTWFPFYEFVKNPDHKLKDSERKAFSDILEFIFPGSRDDSEAYNSYSDSRDAPWLDCLLKTSYIQTQRLNEIINLYADYITDSTDLLFNDDWVEAMDNLEDYRDEIRRIPSQRGNEGSTEVEAPTPVQKNSDYLPVPQRSMPTPVPPQMPAPMPMQAQPPGYPPNYPQQPYPYPQQPVIQPPQQGLTCAEDGKLDFRSVSSVNPMVAAAASVATPLTGWQQAQPVYQDPRLGGYPAQYPPPGYPMQQAMPPGYPMQQAYPPGYPQPGYPQQPYSQPGYPIPGIRSI